MKHCFSRLVMQKKYKMDGIQKRARIMEQYEKKSAFQNEINLYCLIGEAVCMVQVLEDALSTLITLKKEVKKPFSISSE
jgi:hypothetical protein